MLNWNDDPVLCSALCTDVQLEEGLQVHKTWVDKLMICTTLEEGKRRLAFTLDELGYPSDFQKPELHLVN